MTTSQQSWCRFLRSHACNSLIIIIIIIIINKEEQIKIKQIILERIQQTDRQTDRQAGRCNQNDVIWTVTTIFFCCVLAMYYLY